MSHINYPDEKNGWWSKITDSGSGSLSDCLKTLYKAQTKELLLRPLPLMLGNGQAVDLLKLYLVVRNKGGYENASRYDMWEVVAKESGFDSSVSTSLKLVYVKYLDMLDSWFEKLVKEKRLSSMKLESEISDVSSIMSSVKSVDGKSILMGFEGENKKLNKNDEIQSCEGPNGGKDCASDKDDNMGSESSVVKEDEASRKRKRECHLTVINWVRRVAKDPCNPAIGSIPERYKWKSYSNDNLWKQVLLAREAMLLKRHADNKAIQSIWQIKQKMHPSMYEDRSVSDRARCSQRIILAKESRAVLSSKKSQVRESSESSYAQSDLGDHSHNLNENSLRVNNIRRKKIPLGPCFQAKLPKWTSETSQSEKKWLGTLVWPLDKAEQNRNLIERDRIGKGRQESCGCQFPGSQECVRFHISEKRNKVRLELGPVFKQWELDNIGEEVSLSWNPQEEKTFQAIIQNNPASLEKCFWDEIKNYFRNKSREVIVSYYFNVYLLRRRAHQNRVTPSDIDSDDDELEKYGTEHEASSGSIFCSPKKVHLNSRK